MKQKNVHTVFSYEGKNISHKYIGRAQFDKIAKRNGKKSIRQNRKWIETSFKKQSNNKKHYCHQHFTPPHLLILFSQTLKSQELFQREKG